MFLVVQAHAGSFRQRATKRLLLVHRSLSIERKHSWYRFLARPSVGLSVCLSGKCIVAKQMPFGVVSGVSRGMGVLDRGGYR